MRVALPGGSNVHIQPAQDYSDVFLYGNRIDASIHGEFVTLNIRNDDGHSTVWLSDITPEKLMAALGEAMARRIRVDAYDLKIAKGE
jgi:hypothetical protein